MSARVTTNKPPLVRRTHAFPAPNFSASGAEFGTTQQSGVATCAKLAGSLSRLESLPWSRACPRPCDHRRAPRLAACSRSALFRTCPWFPLLQYRRKLTHGALSADKSPRLVPEPPRPTSTAPTLLFLTPHRQRFNGPPS